MITTYQAHPVAAAIHQLAEGPVWDGPRARVLWVDIDAGEVFVGRIERDDVVITSTHSYSTTVGALAVASDGGLLVAAGGDLVQVATDGSISSSSMVLQGRPGQRLNDGKCDPSGRFVVGSLTLPTRAGAESLYRLEHDGSVTVIDHDLSLSNGLGWSPDGTTMYSVDSVPGVVLVRAYDPFSSAVGPRRELFRIDDGLPDGLCVDIEGCLWVAVWGAGEVRRYGPDGSIRARVAVAAPNVTSAAFVGPDLDRLIITTATSGLSPDGLARAPQSGRLFLADVGVRGQRVAGWAGVAKRRRPME